MNGRGYTVLDEETFGLPNGVVITKADGSEEYYDMPLCNHSFINTHKTDEHGTLIWKCIKCGKKVSST